MRHDEIVRRFRVYCHSEEKSYLLRVTTTVFLSGINQRIRGHHGAHAEYALRKVLEAIFVFPQHSRLCLNALLQLCRDDPFAFTELQDANLISRIYWEYYFSPLSLERLYVETQEGVV